jgi:hypothetical protein
MQRDRLLSIARSAPAPARRAAASAAVAVVATVVFAPGAAVANLVVAGNHQILQSHAGGVSAAGDAFGKVLAAGDFNRDGHDDLAIAAPNETVSGLTFAGIVYVVYGSAAGLGVGTTPLTLHRAVAGVLDAPEQAARFGSALAAGDFDGDGYGDLAVGVPFDDLLLDGLTYPDHGSVQLFFGSAGGIVAAADQVHYAGGVFGDGSIPYTGNDEFGFALAACDRDGDAYMDLVIGAPRADWAAGESGAAAWLRGTASGLTLTGTQVYSPLTALAQAHFGSAVACGHLAGSDDPYLFVGAPNAESATGQAEAGRVYVFRPGLPPLTLGFSDADDRLGSALGVGRFGSREELLMAAPGASPSGQDHAGAVVAYIDGTSIHSINQDWTFYGETAEPFDRFAAAIAVGDFNRDGRDDAVFGVPGENLYDGTAGQKLDAGLVHVVYGSADDLMGVGSQVWTWDDPLSFGTLANDKFGAALAVGDFDGNGVDDLAIGAPDAQVGDVAGAGIVQVVYGWPPGWIFGDDFEAGHSAKWSDTVD